MGRESTTVAAPDPERRGSNSLRPKRRAYTRRALRSSSTGAATKASPYTLYPQKRLESSLADKIAALPASTLPPRVGARGLQRASTGANTYEQLGGRSGSHVNAAAYRGNSRSFHERLPIPPREVHAGLSCESVARPDGLSVNVELERVALPRTSTEPLRLRSALPHTSHTPRSFVAHTHRSGDHWERPTMLTDRVPLLRTTVACDGFVGL
ncbi:hypothetical protein Trad_1222 [Truepera radiovictrix DSM 17093]|uniref:Uncharacterized protein n=1 Tax=Truepera radiovictrix (strain DSM 17093 / CIP 108686 / LMG 22925 / RQ-24) TaxID=649638 RepID=D7CWE6_TRURR|nr:hypothetical protein Trad_1222 [Truepera radiovictrix DSM 17093]